MPEFVVGARWIVNAKDHANAAERLASLLQAHVPDAGVSEMDYLGVYQSSDSPSDAREMVEQRVLYTRSNE